MKKTAAPGWAYGQDELSQRPESRKVGRWKVRSVPYEEFRRLLDSNFTADGKWAKTKKAIYTSKCHLCCMYIGPGDTIAWDCEDVDRPGPLDRKLHSIREGWVHARCPAPQPRPWPSERRKNGPFTGSNYEMSGEMDTGADLDGPWNDAGSL